MGYGKEKIKQICLMMTYGALLVLTVIHFERIMAWLELLLGIASPFIVGGVIAFILNLPMKALEERFLARWKGKSADKLKRPVSMLLSIVFVVLILALVVITVVPQLQSAAAVLGKKIPKFAEMLVEELTKLSVQYPQLNEQVAALENLNVNWNSLADKVINFLRSGVGSMLTSTVSVASGIIGGVVNFVISFIFALYILSQKEQLADQGRRIMAAYLSERAYAKAVKVLALTYRNFSKFITGQCVEAVILGTMFVIAMTIFRMPYAVMVGVLIAFTALIPVVGAFIGCVVGAFLILIENPVLALWFVVLFLVLQQLEGNLIYPRVVGNSVGLPAIWVLMAVSLGGSLFGVVGMLVFIPLLSTVYALLRESVNARNGRKALLKATKQSEVIEAAEAARDAAVGEQEAVKDETIQTSAAEEE